MYAKGGPAGAEAAEGAAGAGASDAGPKKSTTGGDGPIIDAEVVDEKKK
jgi:hypothetical protein